LPSCFVLEHTVDTVIETERLRLRPLRIEDAQAIAEKIDNYEISKNLARVPYPYHLSDAEDFIEWALKLDQRSAFQVITLKQNPEELIGIISYDWMEDKQRAELGYWLIPQHWGKGLMTEATCAMVGLAFNVSGLDRLGSCYFNENPASGKVLTKAGFEFVDQCTQYSKARSCEVPVTTVQISRQAWLNKKAAV
jgi:RimJ/RimL family protein N-acetyltransferase